MKVSIVTGPFLSVPPAPCGAVERVWNDLAIEFARLGHEVTLVCRGWDGLAHREHRDGVSYRRLMKLASSPRLAVSILKDLPYSLRAALVVPRSDVIVTNAFWLPAILGRRKGPVCLNVQRVPKGQMGMYVKRGAACFIAPSQPIADAISTECPAARGLTAVLPNPIDDRHFVPPAEERDFAGPPRLLYTGRLHPEKGIELLIAAFGQIVPQRPSARLRIVGPWRTEDGGGGDAYRASLAALAEGLPVEFGEPVYERAALARELHAATLFCYPSVAEKGETFGVAPLEAMATGLPTVVSALNVFRDFAKDGESALVFDHRAGDPAAELARALARVIDNPALAAQLSTAGAQTGRDYSIKRVAQRALVIFEGLITKRN